SFFARASVRLPWKVPQAQPPRLVQESYALPRFSSDSRGGPLPEPRIGRAALAAGVPFSILGGSRGSQRVYSPLDSCSILRYRYGERLRSAVPIAAPGALGPARRAGPTRQTPATGTGSRLRRGAFPYKQNSTGRLRNAPGIRRESDRNPTG